MQTIQKVRGTLQEPCLSYILTTWYENVSLILIAAAKRLQQ